MSDDPAAIADAITELADRVRSLGSVSLDDWISITRRLLSLRDAVHHLPVRQEIVA